MNLPTHKILLILTCLFWALMVIGQFGRIQLSPTVAVYLHDFLIMTTLGWFTVIHREIDVASLKKNIRLHRWWFIFICWVVIIGISASLIKSEIVHWFYLMRVMVYLIFSWELVSHFKWPGSDGVSNRLLDGYLLTGLVFMLVGLLQYIFFPDTRFLSAYGWDDHYYRLLSTQFDPAYAGALILLTFFGLESLTARKWRIFCQVLAVICLALTFSRASYLGFGIGICVLGGLGWWDKRSHWLPLIFIPLLGVSILLAPKPTGEGVDLTRTSTIVSRSTAAQTLVTSVQPWEWVVGRGLFVPIKSQSGSQKVSGIADHAQQSDNVFITLLSGLGVIGVTLLGKAIWSSRMQLLSYPSWVWAMIAAILVHSQFNNTLFQPFVFLMLCGMILGAKPEKN